MKGNIVYIVWLKSDVTEEVFPVLINCTNQNSSGKSWDSTEPIKPRCREPKGAELPEPRAGLIQGPNWARSQIEPR